MNGVPPVDLSGGLKRIGGNRSLFIKILGHLLEKYRDLPAECLALLDAAKMEDVERRAHTLKGNAAMLGLAELSEACSQLEGAAHGRSESDCRRIAETLGQVLTPALDAVAQALEQARRELEAAAVPVFPETTGTVEALLTEVLDLLDRGEYGAHLLLARIQATGGRYGPEFSQVCEDVDNGDYDEAFAKLRLLVDRGRVSP